MAIYQTNLWICDFCGKHTSTIDVVEPKEQVEVSLLPEDKQWGLMADEAGNEFLACAECLEAQGT